MLSLSLSLSLDFNTIHHTKVANNEQLETCWAVGFVGIFPR
jgi:hypothetical protein